MSDEINLTIAIESVSRDGQKINMVNARDLWKALESKQNFADWIKPRIEQAKEGMDFIVHKVMNGETKGLTGMAPLFEPTEYYLTFNLAKHVALRENTQKGAQVRQYFIDVEEKARLANLGVPMTYIEALRAHLKGEEQKAALQLMVSAQEGMIAHQEGQLAIQAPAVEFHKKFADSKALFGLRETGGAFGLGQKAFITMCADNKIIYRLGGKWTPYAPFKPKFMEVKFDIADNGAATLQAHFTTVGVDWIANRLGLTPLTDAQKAALLAAKEKK